MHPASRHSYETQICSLDQVFFYAPFPTDVEDIPGPISSV
jgi:hypothetical protein